MQFQLFVAYIKFHKNKSELSYLEYYKQSFILHKIVYFEIIA